MVVVFFTGQQWERIIVSGYKKNNADITRLRGHSLTDPVPLNQTIAVKIGLRFRMVGRQKKFFSTVAYQLASYVAGYCIDHLLRIPLITFNSLVKVAGEIKDSFS